MIARVGGYMAGAAGGKNGPPKFAASVWTGGWTPYPVTNWGSGEAESCGLRLMASLSSCKILFESNSSSEDEVSSWRHFFVDFFPGPFLGFWVDEVDRLDVLAILENGEFYSVKNGNAGKNAPNGI